MIDGFELDPAWPRMTIAEVNAALTAPGARFEMETVTIRGVPTRVWKNAPPSLPMLAPPWPTPDDDLRGRADQLRGEFPGERRSCRRIAPPRCWQGRPGRAGD